MIVQGERTETCMVRRGTGTCIAERGDRNLYYKARSYRLVLVAKRQNVLFFRAICSCLSCRFPILGAFLSWA